ncbi:MAG: alpha/beta fold hydrolase [Janthinobacterium lividum]
MHFIRTAMLDIAYLESGPSTGKPVILLHGFPYDVHAYDVVAAHLSQAGMRCLRPCLRGFGATRFTDAASLRSGQQAALGADLLAFMDALQIDRALLVGYDWGGRAACIVAALWPQRVEGLVSCGTGYNIQHIASSGEPANPAAEHRLWYQYYLHGERGRAGLQANRDAFCRLLWTMWSPSWPFTAQEFEQTAVSFDNADFVDVVTHSYRHRFGLAPGDPQYRDIEARLALQPAISVPTAVLEGSDDGVTPPEPDGRWKNHFKGPLTCRRIAGAGHNLPQEAPSAVSSAVIGLLSA